MESSETVKVAVVIDPTPNTVACTSSFTADELCILLCKKYEIPPLTRSLFALRIKGSDYYLKDNSKVLSSSRDYELRIRFKVPKLDNLKTLDEKTYDYYFQQARNDVYCNKVSEIIYPDHRKEVFGLGITDMYRAILEDNLSLNEVKKNCKKHIPKLIMKRHGLFAKKQVHETLPKMCAKTHDCSFVKSTYIQQLNFLAPNYLSEEYRDIIWKNGNESVSVHLHVAPFHQQQAGIRLYNVQEDKWSLISSIEELVYLIRNADNCLEISRRGTPLFFKFNSEEQLSSFISVCDRYYRLMIKWTFNLSKDDESPSLRELQRAKCHGPVGGAFSYRKLEEKRAKKYGCYILRQCQDEYNIYFLDVCTNNNTTSTYRVEYRGSCYLLAGEEYRSMEQLVSAHQQPGGRLYLRECLPPSEYDKSQLLLCGSPQKVGVRVEQAELQDILRDNRSPRCLSGKDIILYARSMRVGRGGITATHRAHWKLDRTRKLEVAYKTLQDDKLDLHLKDFIELASKWACVQSSSIVRLYGITLTSPTAMVLEYLPYGPFDHYLREKGSSVPPLQLKKAAASVARALWELSEAGVVHGHIRCRRLLLARAEPQRLLVKLAGPSLLAYSDRDVHWMPVEMMADMSQARRAVAGDIWAFATTLWEIFSYGQSPADTNPVRTAKSYSMGERLHRPEGCPSEVWSLVRQVWQQDPHLRPRPQELMRDVNHMLHAEYVPAHIYEEPKISLDTSEHDDTVSSGMAQSESDGGSNKSLLSGCSLPSINGLSLSDHYDNHIFAEKLSSLESLSPLLPPLPLPPPAPSLPPAPSPRPASPEGLASFHAPRLMESIVSQGKTYLVTLTDFKLGWLLRQGVQGMDGEGQPGRGRAPGGGRQDPLAGTRQLRHSLRRLQERTRHHEVAPAPQHHRDPGLLHGRVRPGRQDLHGVHGAGLPSQLPALPGTPAPGAAPPQLLSRHRHGDGPHIGQEHRAPGPGHEEHPGGEPAPRQDHGLRVGAGHAQGGGLLQGALQEQGAAHQLERARGRGEALPLQHQERRVVVRSDVLGDLLPRRPPRAALRRGPTCPASLLFRDPGAVPGGGVPTADGGVLGGVPRQETCLHPPGARLQGDALRVPERMTALCLWRPIR